MQSAEPPARLEGASLRNRSDAAFERDDRNFQITASSDSEQEPARPILGAARVLAVSILALCATTARGWDVPSEALP